MGCCASKSDLADENRGAVNECQTVVKLDARRIAQEDPNSVNEHPEAVNERQTVAMPEAPSISEPGAVNEHPEVIDEHSKVGDESPDVDGNPELAEETLARSHEAKGEWAQAEAMYRQILDKRRQRMATCDPDFLETMQSLRRVLLMQNELSVEAATIRDKLVQRLFRTEVWKIRWTEPWSDPVKTRYNDCPI